ncbi:TPA: flagellar export chaperone FlgN [Vibrio diabolicus]
MASAVSQRIQQFIRSIPEDIKLYQQLIPLLQQQKTLYLKFDGEALSNNVQKQMPILNKLSRSTSDRSQCMRELGLACTDASVKRIFNALPAQIGMQARKQWALLETLVSQCQQYNQSNGHSSAAFHELVSQLKQPVQHTYEDKSF